MYRLENDAMKIFFLQVDHYTILPMLFFRLLGYNIYFLGCAGWLRKEQTLRHLSKIGLIWFSHQENEIERPGKILHDQYIHSMRIGMKICSLESYQSLVKAIGKDVDMYPCIYQLVSSNLGGPLELLYSILASPTASKAKAKVWIPNTIITRSLLEAYPDVSNRCPRLWTVCELYFHGAGRLVSKVLQLVSMVLNQVFRGRQHGTENDKDPKHGNLTDLQDYEVAYFPHMGVTYGNLFLKDHFYSSESANPFFHEKVIHFEFHGNKSLPPEALAYYREMNIQNENWLALPYEKRIVAKSLFSFLAQSMRHRLRGLDVDLLVKYAWVLWSVQSHRLRLQNLPKLKIVLIGYDIVFPPTLAVACRLQGVQTIAVQERMLATWWSTPLLIEHYFVIGPEAHYYLKSTAQTRMFFYELGPIRLKDHVKAKIPEMISGIREKYSCIVLALDVHSETDWFNNGRSVGNSWRRNMLFYDHLLSLCHDFPDAFFLLKGKNTDFIQVPFFKEMVCRLREQTNLLVLENQTLWTPFTSVASADIAVARPTSLADEMLALGKPVIIDNYDKVQSDIYDYGPDVTAYSYDDMREKLTRFVVDPLRYNASLNNLRKKLYTVSDQPIEQLLQRELMAIWNVCRGSE